MSLIDRLHGHVEEGGLTLKRYKYRCVQTITTKLDEIPVSTIVNKKDYSVERFTDAEGTQGFAFSVRDDIPSIFPEQYEESITLVNELENMKVNAIIGIDPKTGQITKVLNHKEIIDLWDEEKKHLTEKYKFLKGTAGSNALNNLIKIEDKIIYQYDTFMKTLAANPFYSIFFGQYLVSDQPQEGDDIIPYSSRLFPDNKFNLETQRKSEIQEDGTMLLECTGKNSQDSHFDEAIRKAYDEKIKPVVQYSFTQYNINFTQQSWINQTERCLQKGTQTVIEEVTDNLTLSIDLQIRRLTNTI
ncbi:hypothetical protein [Prevotella intermedia]|jgi:hypothetical protein|uniref:hypothetical protein n=1 Tax=Prevotella intermedia TaxID=28131 RepID=UPI002004C65D|nr:hypothetical protein [Prevotella intermedia]MCK6144538.1 hypothetical protein [Prevotella intermedia]